MAYSAHMSRVSVMQCVSAGVVMQPYRPVRCTAHECVSVMRWEEHIHCSGCLILFITRIVRVCAWMCMYDIYTCMYTYIDKYIYMSVCVCVCVRCVCEVGGERMRGDEHVEGECLSFIT